MIHDPSSPFHRLAKRAVFVPLPLNQHCTLSLRHVIAGTHLARHEAPAPTAVSVTLLPSNHCPGAVMLLFEPVDEPTTGGAHSGARVSVDRVLYMGDARIDADILAAMRGDADAGSASHVPPCVYQPQDYALAGRHLQRAIQVGSMRGERGRWL